MSSKRIRVGDKVRIHMGVRTIVGQVTEDRGPIGIGGRRLYRVDYELDKGNWYLTELPADEIEVIKPKKETA
jgi:hypothetical protein